MAEENINILNDFPPVSTKEWEDKIASDLKGKDYERALVWKTNEGFNVHPYYRRGDIEKVGDTNAHSGEPSYLCDSNKSGNAWLIRQDIMVEDVATANKKAAALLDKGVNSLGFVFEGCSKLTIRDLDILLSGICLEAVEVNLVCNCVNLLYARVFAEYIRKNSSDKSKVKASVSVDPISDFMLTGRFYSDEGAVFSDVKSLVEDTSDIIGMSTISVAGKNFSNAGSSIVQELAFSLAMGVEYLTNITDAGVDAGIVAPKMRFNLGVSSNYFMELAKLRAGRMLWARIVGAFKPKCNCPEWCCAKEKCCDGEVCRCAGKMHIHSETSVWNKTVYDPYVNMLRTQTEAMSASLGGTNSLTVLPFNVTYEDPTEFSERIARNQQILLKEESHFDKVADPAAGSYYIEFLTTSIAKEAWELFMKVQDKGGFIAAFYEGFIQSEIGSMAEKRRNNVATRKENLLGVNQFPDFTEYIDSEVNSQLFEVEERAVEGAKAETLKLFRGARDLEALRYATDRHARDNKRPVAFMLTIGNLAMRKARAQFSCNFFAVAGYKVIDNNGFKTVGEGVEAAKAASADIVVMCSSDDEYASLAPAAFEQLGSDVVFVVAGAPACAGDLKSVGVENFINVKTNLLSALKEYNAKLGVKIKDCCKSGEGC